MSRSFLYSGWAGLFYTVDEPVYLMKWMSRVFLYTGWAGLSYTMDEPVFLMKWMSWFFLYTGRAGLPYKVDEPVFLYTGWANLFYTVEEPVCPCGLVGTTPNKGHKGGLEAVHKIQRTEKVWEKYENNSGKSEGQGGKKFPQVLESPKDADNVLRGGALKDSFSTGGLS